MHRVTLAALILGLSGTAATVTAAAAQDLACGSRGEMTDRLKRSFGEVQTGLGMISSAQVLEVWSSEETGTWTILMTDTNGQSCMVAAGEAWKAVEPELLAKGDPV